jgi:hypothetical protein
MICSDVFNFPLSKKALSFGTSAFISRIGTLIGRNCCYHHRGYPTVFVELARNGMSDVVCSE